jgi:chemotaxis protein CheD
MNHFLLGVPSEDAVVGGADRSRYGVHAMEVMTDEMMEHGAARARLRAHVYGGATLTPGLGAIGRTNAQFAIDFVAAERIPLGHCDVGGERARRVEFCARAGQARAILVAVAVPTIASSPRGDGEVELFGSSLPHPAPSPARRL